MRNFLIGNAAVWCLCIALECVSTYPVSRWRVWESISLVPRLTILPLTLTWLVAGMLHARLPRRFLDAASPSGVRSLIMGVMAGVLAVAITTGIVVFLRPGNFDELALGVGAIASTWAILHWPGSLRRAGFCARCDYNICASIEFGRCPECGAHLSPSC